ncbi:hypothetical protein [Kaarinaea lacus]
MASTLVIQSHRAKLPYPWIEQCLDSVRHWCELNHFGYRFLNDELFDYVPGDLRDRLNDSKVIASDLGRLIVLHEALEQEYETVVWLDADFLIFDPDHFILSDDDYAVGRETWVQNDEQGKLKVFKKVHNALLLFRRGDRIDGCNRNSFLDFYRDTAERLLRQNRGGIPPQFIGPKLLTALHNVVQLPVMETAGMLSPLVIQDIINGGGKALQRFVEQSPSPIAGANLCISSREKEELSCEEMEQVIRALLDNSSIFSQRN